MVLLSLNTLVEELPRRVKLKRCDNGEVEQAELIRLTPEVAKDKIDGEWWLKLDLRENPKQPEDFGWKWHSLIEAVLDYECVECVAVRTGDGSIQGAMISYMYGSSGVIPETQVVEIKRLATSPSNRKELVLNPRFIGPGTELFTWALFQSYTMGWGGRLNLTALSGAVEWYVRQGLILTGKHDSEGLPQYEISEVSAQSLLRKRGYIT